MLKLLWLLLLIAPGLAGCTAPSQVEALPIIPSEPTPFSLDVVNGTTGSGWQIIVPGPACGSFCEPVIAVGHDGRVFVKGITYARSSANGSFEPFNPPAVPADAPEGSFQTDRHLQIAPDGALWFHSLIGSNQGVFLLIGVQASRSTDSGDNWVSTYFPFDGEIPSQSLGADRQWMAFASDGTAYLTFQQNAIINNLGTPVGQPNTANIWATRSDDNGATWSRFSPMDGLDLTADQATGQPIVDADGRLVIPFHRFSPFGAVTLPQGFAVAVSPDGTNAVQYQINEEGTMFPALAQLPDGTYIAAQNNGDSIAWATSKAVAGPWELAPMSEGKGVLSSPWIGVRPDGRWDLVWMQGDGSGSFDLWHSLNGLTPTIIGIDFLGGPGIRANTDFVHAGYLDGRLLVVTSDQAAGATLLLLEPA